MGDNCNEEEIILTPEMLDSAALAAENWPDDVACENNWQYDEKPGCG